MNSIQLLGGKYQVSDINLYRYGKMPDDGASIMSSAIGMTHTTRLRRQERASSALSGCFHGTPGSVI